MTKRLERHKTALEKAGVFFDGGLTSAELRAVEARYGFRFPPDLEAFLAFAVPVNCGFVDWRHADPAAVRQRLEWPFQGMSFSLAHSNFWLPEWGVRPTDLAEARAYVKQVVTRAPVLIPICGHRYLPDRPCAGGNPVFSVHQTDIIHYGKDLFHYLRREFRRPPEPWDGEVKKTIEFWSRMVEWGDSPNADLP